MNKKIVEVSHADMGYGKEVLIKDLSFSLDTHEFVALVGPNGSGKTTLVKSLLKLLPTLSGEIKTTKSIGYVPQHAKLELGVPLTVEEFLSTKQDPKITTSEILSRLGFTDDILSQPLQNLSTGQRQRILVAYALLSKPELVILDEATDGLDFKSQQEFFQLLGELKTESGMSILLVSHDITAVGSFATRAICLNRALLFDGAPNSQEFHACLHGIYGRDSVIHDHQHHHHHGPHDHSHKGNKS